MKKVREGLKLVKQAPQYKPLRNQTIPDKKSAVVGAEPKYNFRNNLRFLA
jgi:hypothetical protein